MKQAVTINGREHTLEWALGEVFSCAMDGEPFEAQAAEISAGVISILIHGKSYAVRVAPSPSAEGNGYDVQVDGVTYPITVNDPRRWSRGSMGATREGPQQIMAPMPGKVARVLVAEGERVEAGQGLLVVEAMKMQNEIKASASGTVKKLFVVAGQPVSAGEKILVIE